jgi:UDPglucose 6-dehydrogenase|tara:strand:- start:3319 stop:4161 length:843 start_codon:yes stop_codon:yes gene_type:complete
MIIKTVGVIGQGFVGRALKEEFSQYYAINTYDKFLDGICTHGSIVSLCEASDVVFVCVPTPMKKDGSCDISIVEQVCSEAVAAGDNHFIVIKSTVTPGTTDYLNDKLGTNKIVFNPEFLTERFASNDFKNTNRVILGGDILATTALKQFYSHVFPNVKVIKTEPTVAEYVKYLSNCFLTVKVSVANEFAKLCEAQGVDYDKVTEYANFDPRLGDTHWVVPGPDGKMGFGGSCFPKDLNSIIALANKLGTPCHTMSGAWETNLEVRPEKDWEQLKGRAVVK